jgi:Tol biopolymer transport system component
LYGSDNGKQTIFLQDFDRRGPAAVVFAGNTDGAPEMPGAIARDRSWVLMSAVMAKTGTDIVRYDIASGRLTPIVQTPFGETDPVLSPDERWVAYSSDRSGRREIYVEPVTGGGGLFSVSTAGGEMPRWRGDGKELFFLAAPDRLMSVTVGGGAGLQLSSPKELFRVPFSFTSGYAVASDGQQFIVGLQQNAGRRQLMTIVSDWHPR